MKQPSVCSAPLCLKPEGIGFVGSLQVSIGSTLGKVMHAVGLWL